MEKVKGKNIVVVGAGSIGTAIGNSLAVREDLTVSLLSIELDVIQTIQDIHINQKYFPNIRLHPQLEATSEDRVLLDAEIVILAIPSNAIMSYLRRVKDSLPDDSILINLAKGFGDNNMLIPDCIHSEFPNPVFSLKGPSFAREIINNTPTAFTLSGLDNKLSGSLSSVFKGTNLFIDTTDDIRGVEILSILKNIYAIIIGIVDAHFNSPNLRFMIFTKAFNEMRSILLLYGGKEETMFNYCGIGDFGLTALNDLSRNRTLGLLIGKGFFTEDISGKVVLEGKIAMGVILKELESRGFPETSFHLMKELEGVFSGSMKVSEFVNELLEN
ncbi:MAG: glycerol-3-phosphate dehydrogenase [Bacteroidales bacterium]|nr:glycerol-3-phosphate dehydrogenase [Bacteroidales bacterium]